MARECARRLHGDEANREGQKYKKQQAGAPQRRFPMFELFPLGKRGGLWFLRVCHRGFRIVNSNGNTLAADAEGIKHCRGSRITATNRKEERVSRGSNRETSSVGRI